MKKTEKIICLLLSVVLLFSASAESFAVSYKTETVDEKLGKVYLSDEYTMWHYSSGVWKVGNAFSSFTWTDAEIGGVANIGKQLQSKTKVTYKYTVPSEWRAMTGNGVYLQVAISPVSKSWSDWYNVSTFTQSYSNGTLTYTFSPYYHLSSLRTFDDYVAGLDVTIPLVDMNWGYNMYSIFKGSSGLGRADGRYWDSSPNAYSSGYMHPKLIKNYTGALRSGYSIVTESGSISSDGLSVGTGTLKKGGAIGLLFSFPLVANISLKGTRKLAVYTEEEASAEAARKAAEEAAQKAAEEAARKAAEEAKKAEEERQRREFIDSLEDAQIHRLK